MSVKRRLDKIIVVDLEATCYPNGLFPEGERPEIIQIGICTLNVISGDIKDQTSFIIKPRHSKISDYCAELTGITSNIVKKGMQFKDACNKITKDFGSKHRVLATYGVSDRIMFDQECKDKQAVCPFGDNYIDVSTLLHIRFAKEIKSNSLSLSEAVKLINHSEFVGVPHNAMWDAYNTAVILKNLL